MTQEEIWKSQRVMASKFLDWFCEDKDNQVTNVLSELPASSSTEDVYDVWLKKYFNPETEIIYN